MKRIPSLDLARGFTVLLIAPIHTMMLYSTEDVYRSWLGLTFKFIAEGPGAELFMMLMGVSFSLSGSHSFKVTAQKAFQLLILAYSLNVFKFVLPMLTGMLPGDFLDYLEVSNDSSGMRSLFLLGDIFHFAAPALVFVFFVYQLRGYRYYSLLLSFIICFVAPLFWNLKSNNLVCNYMLELAGGQPPKIYFPLLPWMVYPLIGLCIGYYIKQAPGYIFGWLQKIGFILIFAGLIYQLTTGSRDTSFYRTYPFDTLYHIGIVLVWLCGWDWISRNVATNHFFKLLTYLSENITQVYCIQWVIVMWLLPVFGFHKLDLSFTVLCIVLTSSLTLLISVFIKLTSKEGLVIQE